MRHKPKYQPGDKIASRYLVHQILMGGMGEVYLCLDLEQNLPYALKTFQERYFEQTQVLRRTFAREVMAWVGLEKHPNIVRCFYMDTLENQPFMVLEWVTGEKGKGADLRGWLRNGPLDLRQAMVFTIGICRGLIHAQNKKPGLVHRDLKPANVMLDEDGRAQLLDFGIAKLHSPTTLGHTVDGAAGNDSEDAAEGTFDPLAETAASLSDTEAATGFEATLTPANNEDVGLEATLDPVRAPSTLNAAVTAAAIPSNSNPIRGLRRRTRVVGF